MCDYLCIYSLRQPTGVRAIQYLQFLLRLFALIIIRDYISQVRLFLHILKAAYRGQSWTISVIFCYYLSFYFLVLSIYQCCSDERSQPLFIPQCLVSGLRFNFLEDHGHNLSHVGQIMNLSGYARRFNKYANNIKIFHLKCIKHQNP